MQITSPGNHLPPVTASRFGKAFTPVAAPHNPPDQPPIKSTGAMTQGYYKKQIALLEAQSAQYTKMMTEHPSMIGDDPMIKSTLADNKRYIDNYTRAMATAPKGSGDYVIFSTKA
jgi:hypothetical protein